MVEILVTNKAIRVGMRLVVLVAYKGSKGWLCRCGTQIPFGEEIVKHTETTAHYKHTDYYCMRCAQSKGYIW